MIRVQAATVVLAAVIGAALLAGCGSHHDHAEQEAAHAAGTPGSPVVAMTPHPGLDGMPGQPGKGAAAGAGGDGGLARTTADGPVYVKSGVLECPPDHLVSAGPLPQPEDASFESLHASDTPEGALKKDLRRMRESRDAYTQYLGGLRYEKLSQQKGQAIFAGRREDGSAARVVRAEQGGQSRSWLPIGDMVCSSEKARANPDTYDDDNGNGSVVNDPAEAG